ncbi:MAG: triose-phosphate isomerase [Desulfobacteraceae bacterium]|nr:triose-phosphate isomerase [Desulfobacteraceae bacterium]
MTTYIVANWGSNATFKTAEQWLKDFSHYYTPRPGVEVVVAPPFVFLHDLKNAIGRYKPDGLALAVQDLSPFPFGEYAGAIAAEMIRGIANFAILGHFSRRRYFHETHQEIANKVSEAVAAEITPILCLDPSYARAQMAALEDVNLERLILAYDPYVPPGPTAAISPRDAGKAVADIAALAPGRPVLYGGPVRPDNVRTYLDLDQVSGLLVGPASLDPIDFASICTEAVREEALA